MKKYLSKNEVLDLGDNKTVAIVHYVLLVAILAAFGIIEYHARTGVLLALGLPAALVTTALSWTISSMVLESVVNKQRLRANPTSEPLIKATTVTYGE